ncbi:dihydroneopterin triphosphate diphosphatase [uncultured Alteromonas sp.]|uniref:dihydroneopterin triphosphate diphosphatase n=1 Tax=uncultured Alteromonas sp. TaxID=179113 RepID=UPI0030EC60AE|tara:strand:- start:19 stop:459 length:441 start_codon:yes stop_codon:yes gene_type:complete
MAYKKPESVLVVLYDQHHKVLLLQRNDDPEFWQSVTGAMEDGELPIETAYREVAEETGIDAKQLSIEMFNHNRQNQYEIRNRWLHRYPPGTRFNTEHVFSLQVDSTLPLVLTEHLQYEWVDKAQALARLWSPSNKEAVSMFVPNVP